MSEERLKKLSIRLYEDDALEAEILNAYYSVPFSRRQEWLRRLLSVGYLSIQNRNVGAAEEIKVEFNNKKEEAAEEDLDGLKGIFGEI